MRFRFVVIVHPDEGNDSVQTVVQRQVLSVIDRTHIEGSPKVYFCETLGGATAIQAVVAGRNPGKMVSISEISSAVAAQPGPTKAFKISSSGVLPA